MIEVSGHIGPPSRHTPAGLCAALHRLPAVSSVCLVEESPQSNVVQVRVELSRRSWLALGAIHGYVRGEAERILRASLPGHVSFTLEVL